MNRLLHLQEKLRETGAALGRLEAELAKHEGSRSLQSNILSLRKLHQNLQNDFQSTADELGFDICHYRMLDDRPSAKAFSRAIGAFQDAISLAYDAIRNGPKTRKTLSQDVAEKTELQLAYAYPGSFGVVFTIPNTRLLFPDLVTQLDEAAQTVLTIGKASDNVPLVSKTAKELGRGAIVAIYEWAKANSVNQTGAAVQWISRSAVREDVTIQAREFLALSDTLERIGEKVESDIEALGVLVGANIQSRRFSFLIDESDVVIHGRFTDAISQSQQAKLPARYKAFLHKTVEVSYATEEEKVAYFLIRLEPTTTLSTPSQNS